jgi:cell division protein FtsW (lipid II flippase)
MKPWILALILTIVVFGAIQLFGSKKDNQGDQDDVTSSNELVTQVATFGAILVVSLVLCYWFDSGSSSETIAGGIDGTSTEAEMLKRIKEEITVGLPPF